MKKTIKKLVLDFMELLFIGTAIFIFSWFFLAEPLEVTGGSMEPTLYDKEQLIAEKVSIKFNDIQRGDILVFKNPKNTNILVIKRVIGLPNERFLISDNNVYINSKKLSEDYLRQNTMTKAKGLMEEDVEVLIPSDNYILMGDNRENSSDSRNFGTISKDLIVGRALFVYYPSENLRFLDNIDFFLSSSMVNKLNNALNF